MWLSGLVPLCNTIPSQQNVSGRDQGWADLLQSLCQKSCDSVIMKKLFVPDLDFLVAAPKAQVMLFRSSSYLFNSQTAYHTGC